MDYIQKNKLFQIIKLIRPIHWVKNFSIFAALIFSGSLLNLNLFLITLEAFFIFNFAASATYVFNDILDIQRDRAHPIKKFRPLASGKVSISEGVILALFLAFIALFLAFNLSYFFFLIVLSYLSLQTAYSLYLKHLHIIDILVIASGFVIRVYSGAFVINAHLSVWFLLCVISVALFLASGKRRAELGVLGQQSKTRISLSKYSPELLNSYVTMFGSAAWISWALFTFFESPQTPNTLWIFLAELSKTTTINKLLMITIPVTIFGVMRYQSLIFEGRAEAPEKILLKDISLVSSVLLWVGLVVGILYGGVFF